MSETVLERIRDLIQKDVNNRGLRTDSAANLITACPRDFATACNSLAETPNAVVGVVTGFFIPHAKPPSGETDGPLGALFLARALTPLGMKVVLVTDPFCIPALECGLKACGLDQTVGLVALPTGEKQVGSLMEVNGSLGGLTHLIALERVGPSHTLVSLRSQPGCTPEAISHFLQEIPAEHHDRCHNMKGRDITDQMSPAHLLFEAVIKQVPEVTTIGIGDGGNEIGMGKIPWDIIRLNIPRGGLIACRIPSDQLIVCGVSNWGAYGVAAGVRWLRGCSPDRELFDVERERELLRLMVEKGPLVDGVLGQLSVSVDGLSFQQYAMPLERLRELGKADNLSE
jgi:hypothetical protein